MTLSSWSFRAANNIALTILNISKRLAHRTLFRLSASYRKLEKRNGDILRGIGSSIWKAGAVLNNSRESGYQRTYIPQSIGFYAGPSHDLFHLTASWIFSRYFQLISKSFPVQRKVSRSPGQSVVSLYLPTAGEHFSAAQAATHLPVSPTWGSKGISLLCNEWPSLASS